jgi:hypothetical protein
MSTTPRTDAARLTEPYLVRELSFEVVRAEVMEELETELAAVTAELEMWRDGSIVREEDKAERDALKADKERLDWLIEQGLCWRNADIHIAGWRIGHETEWLYNVGDGARKVIDVVRAELSALPRLGGDQ